MPLPPPSRRNFLHGTLAALPAAGVFSAASDPIRVGLIGCGGRGNAAAVNAMSADPGVRISALADLILARAQESRSALKTKHPDQVAATADHTFAGFDGYRQVLEHCDVVIIANAAKFHPLHMMAAIQAGKHVFVEKPHAVDPAGVKMVRAACELAARNRRCVVSGLQSRYHTGYQEAVKRIHDGAIGDVVAIEENFLREPYVLYPRKPGMTEAEYQGSNQYHFHWLSGDDIPQSLIHNFDRARWVLREANPVKVHGMGGRSTLRGEIYGNVFDHHAVVYEFTAGVRVYGFTRTIPGCYNEVSSIILGTKGRADIIRMSIEGEKPWRYEGPRINPYDLEHVELFKAIRAGRVISDAARIVDSTIMALMGQFSCYSGKEVTWNQFVASDYYHAPRPEDVRAGMEPPTRPGPDGSYPVAFTPGVSVVL